MSLNESIVEEASLDWSRLRQGYAGQVGEQSRVARPLIPAFCLRPSPLRSGSHGEKEDGGEVVLVGRLREAVRRLTPAIPEVARATLAKSATV